MVGIFLSFDSERMAQELCRQASFLKVRSREKASQRSLKSKWTLMPADAENDKSYGGIECLDWSLKGHDTLWI